MANQCSLTAWIVLVIKKEAKQQQTNKEEPREKVSNPRIQDSFVCNTSINLDHINKAYVYAGNRFGLD